MNNQIKLVLDSVKRQKIKCDSVSAELEPYKQVALKYKNEIDKLRPVEEDPAFDIEETPTSLRISAASPDALTSASIDLEVIDGEVVCIGTDYGKYGFNPRGINNIDGKPMSVKQFNERVNEFMEEWRATLAEQKKKIPNE